MFVCTRWIGVVLLAGVSSVFAQSSADEPAEAVATDAPAAAAASPASQPESAAAAAQEPPAAPEAGQPAAKEQPAPEAAAGPKTQQFSQLFSQWQGILAEMRSLQKEYKTADPARQAEIKGRFDQILAQGDALAPQLIDAARQAYAESPGANEAAGKLLMDVVELEGRTENYEAVLPPAETLINAGYPDKSVYAWAGLAAFVTNQFDAAEKYLKAAEENNAFGALRKLDPRHQLRDIGKFYAELLPYYKQVWPKEQKIREAEAKADDLPRVLLVTSKGEIEVELFENEAPNTVANFISLVEKGFYNGLTFHRVLPGFMAQGGCPKGDGTGGPGYTIPCECYQPNHRLHFRGTLSMAHAGRDTGGSQFFITFVPTKHLDGVHTAFGRVVRGMEVLARLQRRDPMAPNPPEPDRIIEAKVLRKRNHDYAPKKTGE
jgi:cyclophilin family peptidyl-prolyl cis-trans isomerase